MTQVHHLLVFWLPPLAYMGAIFGVSHLSQPQIGGEMPDYVLHTLEYFLLTLLLIRLVLAHRLSTRPDMDVQHWKIVCLYGILIAVAYGMTDEIHQYFIPGRHCSLHDVFSDAFGAFLAGNMALLDYVVLRRGQTWKSGMGRLKVMHGLSYAEKLISENPSSETS